jgi:hypothetical protein
MFQLRRRQSRCLPEARRAPLTDIRQIPAVGPSEPTTNTAGCFATGFATGPGGIRRYRTARRTFGEPIFSSKSILLGTEKDEPVRPFPVC